MATICRICSVIKGRPHKMSCNYSKYGQRVVWVDSISRGMVSQDYDYGFTYGDTSSSNSDTSSSGSCDSGGF